MRILRLDTLWRTGAAIAALALAAPGRAAAQEALFQRPAEVHATMANSRTYAGAYASTQVARWCGETDPAQFMTGTRSFSMEFPYDADGVGQIVDVGFDSKSLVGGVRETDKFRVSITVKPKSGGSPGAYIVDTERPTPGDSGRARLEVDPDGTERVQVDAKNSLGETLTLNFVCRPRPR